MVVIEEARGRLDAANRLLSEAAAVSNNTSNELLRLRVLVTQHRVLRQLRPDAREERKALRTAAHDILTPDVLRKLRGSAVLLREVAAELSKDHPQLAAVAIDTLGLEVASDAQAKKLGQAVAALTIGEKGRRVGEVRGRTFEDKVLTAVKRIERAAFDPKVVRKWVTQEVSLHDTQTVGRKLAESAAGEQVLREFRDYFRAGVANTLIPGDGDFEG